MAHRFSLEEIQREEANLLQNIKEQLTSLEELLEQCSGHWGYEDPVYRFYHQSLKVFHLQPATKTIVEKLHSLAPHLPLNDWFLEIHERAMQMELDNANWTATTRPVLEAFFHARYFLEMACKYGKELESPPQPMPSGWAGLLYLYNLRG